VKQAFGHPHEQDIYSGELSSQDHRVQLVSIGIVAEDKELVSIALNGLVPTWRLFV
jgi:hypothetical protein